MLQPLGFLRFAGCLALLSFGHFALFGLLLAFLHGLGVHCGTSFFRRRHFGHLRLTGRVVDNLGDDGCRDHFRRTTDQRV